MSKKIDPDVVRAAVNGNEAAFSKIYETFRLSIYHMMLRMAKGESEAEDLTQEVFLQVFKKIHTFQGKSSFSTWLYRVAFNTALMSMRSVRNRIFKNHASIDQALEVLETEDIKDNSGVPVLEVMR